MRRILQIVMTSGVAIMAAAAIGKAVPAARWVSFETVPEGIIYIDPAAIVRAGNRADMWVLIDYKQPQADRTGKPIRSDTLHYRYDCSARSFTILTSSAHAGSMGSGAVIDTNADPKPNEVPPGTTAEAMWKRACNPVPAE